MAAVRAATAADEDTRLAVIVTKCTLRAKSPSLKARTTGLVVEVAAPSPRALAVAVAHAEPQDTEMASKASGDRAPATEPQAGLPEVAAAIELATTG